MAEHPIQSGTGQQTQVLGADLVALIGQLLNQQAQNRLQGQSAVGFFDPTDLGPGFESFGGNLIPSLSREMFTEELRLANDQFGLDLSRFGLEVANFNFNQRVTEADARLQTMGLLASLRGPENALQANFALNNLSAPAGQAADPFNFLSGINQPFGGGGGGGAATGGAAGAAGGSEAAVQAFLAANPGVDPAAAAQTVQQIGGIRTGADTGLATEQPDFFNRLQSMTVGQTMTVGVGGVSLPNLSGTGQDVVTGRQQGGLDLLTGSPIANDFDIVTNPDGSVTVTRKTVSAPSGEGAGAAPTATAAGAAGDTAEPPLAAAPALAPAPAPSIDLAALNAALAPNSGQQILANKPGGGLATGPLAALLAAGGQTGQITAAPTAAPAPTGATAPLPASAPGEPGFVPVPGDPTFFAGGGLLQQGQLGIVGDDPSGRGRENIETIMPLGNGQVLIQNIPEDAVPQGAPQFQGGGILEASGIVPTQQPFPAAGSTGTQELAAIRAEAPSPTPPVLPTLLQPNPPAPGLIQPPPELPSPTPSAAAQGVPFQDGGFEPPGQQQQPAAPAPQQGTPQAAGPPAQQQNPFAAQLIQLLLGQGGQGLQGAPRFAEGGILDSGDQTGALGQTVFDPNQIAQLPVLQQLRGDAGTRPFGATAFDPNLPGADPGQEVPIFNQLSIQKFNQLQPSARSLYQNIVETPRGLGGLGLDFLDVIDAALRASPTGRSFGPASLVG